MKPKALTITCRDGETSGAPWTIDYEPFLQPNNNAFYRSEAKIVPDA